MPVQPTYPGVYIEELPSPVRTIVGVATSITAFIGRARRGPLNLATRVQSYGDYERLFGGLWVDSTMSYAVRHFFLNGGTDAIVTRVERPDALPATANIGGLLFEAAMKGRSSPGEWANLLRAVVDGDVDDTSDPNRFNLTLQLLRDPTDFVNVVTSETFRNVSTDTASPRFVTDVVRQQSNLAMITGVPATPTPGASLLVGGQDGSQIIQADYQGDRNAKTGLYALEESDLFNLLVLPPPARGVDVPDVVLEEALAYCQERRAMLILDPPVAWSDTTAAEAGVGGLRANVGGTARAINAMVYFPQLRMPDQERDNRLESFPPGGALAGLIARTDANRGVWKAPAGIEASLVGVREMSYKLTDPENGRLNPLGLNCLRTIPPYGHISWGARTLAGDDRLASQWKYIPVRRTALYLEESLFRGLHWVVFEPNDESLWAQIRLNVGSFMQNLFRQGAFQGTTPREAYLVKCDAETNPQTLIDQGVVTVLVGFAPLKPAEFVIIQIQQLTRESTV